MHNKEAAKVCILTTVHPPFDTRIFHKEAKTLVRAGYDVTLIAQHDKDEVVDGVKIVALPKPRNRFTRIFGLTWRAFRLALRQRADAYHFHDPELLPIGVLLKLSTKGKVIYDVHEDYPQMIREKYWIPKPIRGLAAFLFERAEVVGAHIVDAIVAVNESIGNRFPCGKVVLLRNYPVLGLLEEPPSFSPSGSSNALKLVYVGGLNRSRGVYEMVRAMEYIDERSKVQLELIGKFDEPGVEQEIRTLPGFQRAKLVGWIPHPKVYGYLQDAHIGLMCLHPIGDYPQALPVKLFEYMAAGLLVIASNFPLWREFFEENLCGLTVDPLNPKEIAEAIEYSLMHPEEARCKGENGRRAVLEKYNWEKEGAKLLDLYEELAETK